LKIEFDFLFMTHQSHNQLVSFIWRTADDKDFRTSFHHSVRRMLAKGAPAE
jgi:hypothetical protein